MKKRPFLLLEILIAFLIVALAAVPLVTQPLKLFRSEMAFLEQMERERLADWTFTEIKEKLLKNEIPWEKIPAKGAKTGPFPLPAAQIRIPGMKPKKVERSFTLNCRGEKTGLRDEIYRSIHIGIDFAPDLFPKKPSHYSFRLTVRKIGKGE